MSKLYGVVFDNYDDTLNTLQWCNVSSEDDYQDGSGTNITGSLEYAKYVRDLCKTGFPTLNYRVVELTMKEIEQ